MIHHYGNDDESSHWYHDHPNVMNQNFAAMTIFIRQYAFHAFVILTLKQNLITQA